MSLTILIVCLFVLGYVLIATEGITGLSKSAVALLMFAGCWTVFMISPEKYISSGGADITDRINEILVSHLGNAGSIVFFLLGAMIIVEIIDTSGGFDFIKTLIRAKTKRSLLWKISFFTYLLSAILDNMTTGIVMVMILRKLISEREDRQIFSAMVIIAANAGGSFSPIGDVTTIMLWNADRITSGGIMTNLLLPSLAAMIIPALALQFSLKGNVNQISGEKESGKKESGENCLTNFQRMTILILGVGGLMFVPVFRYLSGLPPFAGILLVLAVLWIVFEYFYGKSDKENKSAAGRINKILSKIDLGTIIFFLGILMAVSCLEEAKILKAAGTWLNDISGANYYLVAGMIGILSSVVDNGALVAGCIGMYSHSLSGAMAIDGIFWQLLAYCAGTGGGLMIIGSAVGVVVMGLEKISFGWYMKKITVVAILGYLSGILVYFIQNLIF